MMETTMPQMTPNKLVQMTQNKLVIYHRHHRLMHTTVRLDGKDIGDLGVNDGDDHASDDTELVSDASPLSSFNARNGERKRRGQ